jgi:NHL repeat/Galactose oxidase, central domain
MYAWSCPIRLAAGVVAPVLALAVVGADKSTLTGRMTIARSGHQATLLIDGRVLVTGGSDRAGQAIARAEMYDRFAGTWSLAQANIVPRLGHAAALLHDGRVLVAGGAASARSCQLIGSAELYEPSTDRWSLAADTPVPMGLGGVAVTLVDGHVLISGGGTACGDSSASAAVFDPSSNTWSRTAMMGTPRQFHVATVLGDGRVLVSGGAPAHDGIAAGAELYDPDAATWTAVVPRDSQPLLGTTCDGYLQTYATALGPDSLVARATPDDCSSITMLPAGRLLVAGGTSLSNTARDSTQLTDVISGDQLFSQPLPVARRGHTATRLLNGAVLIAGGRESEARIADAEIYIPQLLHTAAVPFVLVRGWTDRNGAFWFGSPVAASVNSRGHVLISYRDSDPPTRILEWDPQRRGPWRSREDLYVREIGRGLQEFHSIRIDRQDNVWAVSPGGKELVKFSPEGEVLLRFGRRPETDDDLQPERPDPSRARPYLESPLDVAWDANGNLFVADGGAQPRIVKYDNRGRFLAATAGRGSGPGISYAPHSLATDANGNVYVADGGNARIQVFNNNLNLLAAYYGMGAPWAICITRGRHQYLYSASNPNKTDNRRHEYSVGEVYKLELDGTILGKAVGDDASRGLFGYLHHIECRRANEIIGVGIADSHSQIITMSEK